jgi:Kef-type K+ transport system membrane component KefB
MATNATATATAAALQYKEPDIRSVLILSSFLLLLNLVSSILDNVCYCGLVGQVLLGMAWGSPGAKWLSSSLEEAATQLGYLGLIAIVFEGGLAASAKSMQNTFFLSICVALTGILLPIALSFSLVALASATKLQAFAAGAALCSTSLGTTFSLLKTTGLTTSRLGTVLTSAAMLDDVVGLIMVQVIANLGSGRGSIHPSTILRPVFVSVGFATVLPLACKYVVRPFAEKRLFDNTNRPALLNRVVTGTSVGFVLMTAFLMALVSAASYAGTSNLFAAYLAGAIVAWVDENSLLPNAMQTPQPVDSPPQKATRDRPSSASLAQTQGISCSTPTTSEQCADIVNRSPKGAGHATPPPETTSDEDAAVPTPPASAPKMAEKEQLISMHIFNRYYAPAVDSILKPLFFVSLEKYGHCLCAFANPRLVGVNRLLYTNHKDVRRLCRLAGPCVYDSYVPWKAMLRSLARSV